MLRIGAAIAIAIIVSPVHAQTMTTDQKQVWVGARADTVQNVSTELAKIQSSYVASTAYAGSDTGLIDSAMQIAINQMIDLRNSLVDNPYVRLSGFSVGFPAGITAEFEFPEDAQ